MLPIVLGFGDFIMDLVSKVKYDCEVFIFITKWSLCPAFNQCYIIVSWQLGNRHNSSFYDRQILRRQILSNLSNFSVDFYLLLL